NDDLRAIAEEITEEKAYEDEGASPTEKGKYSADLRQKIDIHSTLNKKFFDYMMGFQSLQFDVRQGMETKIAQLLRILNSGCSEAHIQQILDASENEISTKLQRAQVSASDMELDRVRERHGEIVQIAQSISELHSMALDCAYLIEAQTEMLDRVVDTVGMAREYVAKGTEDLERTIRHQRGSRRTMCCILVIVVVVVLVVMGVGLSALSFL
ncbi:hypothetical protein KIPB_012083, partial [Kipferlia bialata]